MVETGVLPNVVLSGMGVSISSVIEGELLDDEKEVRECLGGARQMRSSAGSRKRVSISAMGFLVAR